MRYLLQALGIAFIIACLFLLTTIQGWLVSVTPEQMNAVIQAWFRENIQAWLGRTDGWFLQRLEQTGYFAIGCGTGVTGWFLSGNLAAPYFLRKVPMAWKLWQRDVLTSRLPILKYLTTGFFFLGLGAASGYYLWGLSKPAFDVGLLAGAIFCSVYSLRKLYQSTENRVDFFEANQRYLNEENVALFSEDWN